MADLVKITVYLTREAFNELRATAERENASHTDVVNLAVLAFARLSAEPGQPFAYEGMEPLGGETRG